MKPAPFDYHRAVDVGDAVTALRQADDGKAIAGGQSLIALMNLRLARPELLVDLNPLRELTTSSRGPRAASPSGRSPARPRSSDPPWSASAARSWRRHSRWWRTPQSGTAARSAAAWPTPTPAPSCARSASPSMP